jgi:hypothetical protein
MYKQSFSASDSTSFKIPRIFCANSFLLSSGDAPKSLTSTNTPLFGAPLLYILASSMIVKSVLSLFLPGSVVMIAQIS